MEGRNVQYILTQQELTELTTAKQVSQRSSDKALFELCWLAAQHIPVKRPWRDAPPPSPWGCIYRKSGKLLDECEEPVEGINSMYCDECPSKKICSQPKRYSK